MNFAVSLARLSPSNSSCYPRTGSFGRWREREGGDFHWGAGTSFKRLGGNPEPFHLPSSFQGSWNLSTSPAPLREAGAFPLTELLSEGPSVDAPCWILEIITFSNHYFIKRYWNLGHFIPISLMSRSNPFAKRT